MEAQRLRLMIAATFALGFWHAAAMAQSAPQVGNSFAGIRSIFESSHPGQPDGDAFAPGASLSPPVMLDSGPTYLQNAEAIGGPIRLAQPSVPVDTRGFGLIQPSDACFCDFISPVTNPVFFEDPRTLSELRFVFINHELPTALGENSIQVYAMQIRAALTERLSFIATKDGFIYTQSPLLESGFADLSAGLKYNLFRDPVAGRLLSVGMMYDIPLGSNKSLQGNGNGEFNFFASAAARLGAKAHYMTATGLRQPLDDNLENQIWYWSNHFDRRLGDSPWYFFTESTWWHYMSSANAFPVPIEGGDLFNLGSPGIKYNDLITQGLGFKYHPRPNLEAGVAFEYPVTNREGVLKNRVTADLILRF